MKHRVAGRIPATFLGVLLLAALWAATARAGQDMAANKGAADQPQAARPAAAASGDYRIGPGDVLDISVWKEPELSSPNMVVRPDGKISLPLIDDLAVSGKTPMELQDILTQKLGPFINAPNVTVTVKAIHSKKVYVLGEVAHPGSFDLAGPMTVLQILVEAGGLQPFAKQKSIYVLRKEGGKQEKLPFNYKDVVKGEKMEQNIQLQPGDTVVVP